MYEYVPGICIVMWMKHTPKYRVAIGLLSKERTAMICIHSRDLAATLMLVGSAHVYVQQYKVGTPPELYRLCTGMIRASGAVKSACPAYAKSFMLPTTDKSVV